MAQNVDQMSLDEIIKLASDNKASNRAIPKQQSTGLSKFDRYDQQSSDDDEDESTPHGINWKMENTRNVMFEASKLQQDNKNRPFTEKGNGNQGKDRSGMIKKDPFLHKSGNTSISDRSGSRKQRIGLYIEKETDDANLRGYRDQKNDDMELHSPLLQKKVFNYPQQSLNEEGKRRADPKLLVMQKPRIEHTHNANVVDSLIRYDYKYDSISNDFVKYASGRGFPYFDNDVSECYTLGAIQRS